MINNKKVIVIAGPTASGKTSLGVELAKKINGEIISADSMQIYKRLNIGTAKVTKEEMQGIYHHLIDICNVKEKFSVGQYKVKCYDAIEEILSKGKVPIIVGGTGLYINAVVNNMNFDDNKNETINLKEKEEYVKELKKLLDEKGIEYLYDKLKKLDKTSAEKIHPNNVKRVMRALEMIEMGVSKAEVTNRQSLWKKNEEIYKFYVIYIDIPREILYDRINSRVEQMIENGVLEEAKYLLEENIPSDCTAIQAIGYKELFSYIKGEATLEECKETLKKSTRNYAKRQITWFKKLDKDYIYTGEKTINDIVENIAKEK